MKKQRTKESTAAQRRDLPVVHRNLQLHELFQRAVRRGICAHQLVRVGFAFMCISVERRKGRELRADCATRAAGWAHVERVTHVRCVARVTDLYIQKHNKSEAKGETAAQARQHRIAKQNLEDFQNACAENDNGAAADVSGQREQARGDGQVLDLVQAHICTDTRTRA